MSKRTCILETCDRPAVNSRHCSGHAARLHRLGDVQEDKPLRKRNPGKPRSRDGRADCTVEGCAKPARNKSAELCSMHYHRLYRKTPLGDASQRRRNAKNPECAVDGCAKPDAEAGYCSMHAARIRRHGDPSKVISATERDAPRGEAHHNWVGDEVGYAAAHCRVKRMRGLASSHECSDCDSQAYHWSYDHSDPNEKTAVVAGGFRVAYSPDPTHYSPRCVPCHKRFDLDRINSTSFEFGPMALS